MTRAPHFSPWTPLFAASTALALACSGQVGGPVPGSGGSSASAGSPNGGQGPLQGGASSAGAPGSSGAAQGGSSLAGSGGAMPGPTGGAVSAGEGGSGGAEPPPPFEPAPGMLRRLTRAQFRNAVRDVFNEDVNVAELDSDDWTGSFATIGAAAVATSERGVEQYHTAIESAVDAVFADPARRSALIGCTPGDGANDPCVRDFIEIQGRRAWRRPLEASEIERLATLAANAATELGSPVEGVRWVAITLFTSPSFLYRPELGLPGTDGALRFTGYEAASRLAFLIWNSLPDAALLDAAANGTLGTADGIRSEALRLLDAPAGREAIGAFAEEYMRLDRVSTQAKDAALYPDYGPALQAAMVRDMRETWVSIAFDDRTSALDLFSTTKVVANAELAQLYGLTATGLDSNTFQVLSLPADGPRIGILSKAGFLSQFANQKEGSPTLRGKFIREALLCKHVDPPPGDVDTVLDEPPPDAPQTKRQRLEAHRNNIQCAGCHAQMDPLGLPLETFDAIGRYRTTERGLTIDPSGDFEGTPVADARGLGLTASSSMTVAQCLVRKYYAYALGRPERPVDASVVSALHASFQESGFQLRELVLDLVSHETFSAVAPQP